MPPRWCYCATSRKALHLSLLIALLFVGSCCHQRCGDSAASGPQPRRLALLIGITRYDEPLPSRRGPLLPRLTGAEDVDLLRNVLTKPPWSIPSANVTTLRDEEATRENIHKAMGAIRAEPGDALLVYLGGHGMQIPDDDGDELDGLDESFVPWDYISNDARTAGDSYLRDDQLGKSLAGLRAAVGSMGSVTVILDACHAGTGTRLLAPARGRAWNEELDGSRPPLNPKGRPKGSSGFFWLGQAERSGFAVIAAAADEQQANLAYIPQLKSMHGVLTGELAVVLSEQGPGISFRTLFERVSAQVAADLHVGAMQQPQLEGVPIDRPFFSRSVPRAQQHLAVSAVPDAKTIELPVGQVHGATVGSRYGLFTGCKLDASRRIAEADLVEVRPFSSLARIDDKYLPVRDPAALKAAWVIEESHQFSAQPLRIYLPPGTTLPPLLIGAEFLSTTSSVDRLFDFKLVHAEQTWQLERIDGSRVLAVPEGPSGAETLRKTLLSLWRWAYLARLESPTISLRPAPKVRIVPVKGVPPVAASADSWSFSEDSVVTIELEQSPVEGGFVWITLLQLAPDGSISPIFPAPDDVSGNRVAADGKPHRLPFPEYQFRLKIPGRYYLKAIATTVPVDFTPVITATERTERDIAVSRVVRELSGLAVLLSVGGKGTLPQLRVPLVDWSTSQIAFDVVAARGPS